MEPTIKYRIINYTICPIIVTSDEGDFYLFEDGDNEVSFISKNYVFDSWEETKIHLMDMLNNRIKTLSQEIEFISEKQESIIHSEKPENDK